MVYYSTHVVCTFFVCETVRVARFPGPVRGRRRTGELEEEIVVLAAHSHAAAHRVLTLVAEFRPEAWLGAGWSPLVRQLARVPDRHQSRRGAREGACGQSTG